MGGSDGGECSVFVEGVFGEVFFKVYLEELNCDLGVCGLDDSELGPFLNNFSFEGFNVCCFDSGNKLLILCLDSHSNCIKELPPCFDGVVSVFLKDLTSLLKAHSFEGELKEASHIVEL